MDGCTAGMGIGMRAGLVAALLALLALLTLPLPQHTSRWGAHLAPPPIHSPPLMEVTAYDLDSGKQCVISVTESETILSLKAKILCTLHSRSSVVAEHLTLRIRGDDEGLGDDETDISGTPLESGGQLEIFNSPVNITAPALLEVGGDPFAVTVAPNDLCICVVTFEEAILFCSESATIQTQFPSSPCPARFSPSSDSIVTCGPQSSNFAAEIRDTSTGALRCTLPSHNLSSLTSLGWSSGGDWIVSALSRTVLKWSFGDTLLPPSSSASYGSDTVDSATIPHVEITVSEEVLCTAVTYDAVLCGSAAGTFVFSLTSAGSELLRQFGGGEDSSVHDLAVTKCEQYVVSLEGAANSVVRVWDYSSGVYLHGLDFGAEAQRVRGVSELAVCSAKDVVIGYDEGDVYFWRLSSGAPIGVLRADSAQKAGFPFGVALSSCGRWVFAAVGRGVAVSATTQCEQPR